MKRLASNFMKSYQSMMATFFIIFIVANFGCSSPSDKDRVTDAQYCLNESKYDESALNCLEHISGLYSEEAQILRCSAYFIAANITSSENLTKAYYSIQKGGSTSGVLSILNWKVSNDMAEEIYGYCHATNRRGIRLISALARTATVIANFSSLAQDASPEEIRDNISSILADVAQDPVSHAETLTSIGNAVKGAYKGACDHPEATDVGMCSSIAQATAGINVDTYDPHDMGLLLLDYWKSSNH